MAAWSRPVPIRSWSSRTGCMPVSPSCSSTLPDGWRLLSGAERPAHAGGRLSRSTHTSGGRRSAEPGSKDVVMLLARRHLDVRGGAAAVVAIGAQPPFQEFRQRLIDDAGRRLVQTPRQILKRLPQFAGNFDD